MKNRIGIIGGGQLGRMLAFAAKRMGFYVCILDPVPGSPAGQVSDRQIIAGYNDEEAIVKLAKQSDYLTFEVENANGQFFDRLVKKVSCKINPSGRSWRLFQDKLEQKLLLEKGHIPQPEFMPVNSLQDLKVAIKKLKLPLFLKARFDAYDGRGNVLIKKEKDIDWAWKRLKDKKLYAEEFIPFVKELAIMIGRGSRGEVVPYPVVETAQRNNICHFVLAPAQISPLAKKRATNVATLTLKLLEGAGVFGIEMFYTKNDLVLINEIAPRVHNSGHFTIEACATSQFEQHIRAITGMPLGKPDMIVPAAVMVNILGERTGEAKVFGLEKLLALPYTSVHIYGKRETRIERKMGHITVIGESLPEILKRAQLARKYITI